MVTNKSLGELMHVLKRNHFVRYLFEFLYIYILMEADYVAGIRFQKMLISIILFKHKFQVQ